MRHDGINYLNALTIPSKAGRWVGVKNGVFIMHNADETEEKGGYVTLDYVKYENLTL